MSDPSLAGIVQRFGAIALLILGDLCLQQRVVRAAALSDGEALRVRGGRPLPAPGGAGAVAQAAAQLGARTWVAGIIGRDDAGAEVLRCLAAAGVDAFGVVSDPDHPTARRVIAQIEGPGAPCPVIDIELAPPPPLAAGAAQEMADHLDALVPQINAMFIIAPESAAPDALLRFARLAQGRDKPVIGALAGRPDAWLPPCRVLVCAPAAADASVQQTAQAARAHIEKMGHGAVITPLADGGALVCSADLAQPECVPGGAVGAAQHWHCFAAAVAIAIAAGASSRAAAQVAVAAAAVSAQGAISLQALQRQVEAS